MYRWHKRTFLNLANLLQALEADPGDYATLLTLQRRLVNCIRRTERRISDLKQQRAELQRKKRSRLTKDAVGLVKRLILTADEKLEFERTLLFLFRCFGDGIAYTYIDALALKHVLYNTDDYTVKPSAGALTGKKGLRREWKLLQALATVGPLNVGPVPAVLCDLTNTIRHGDVCVLVGPDPYPIEVKSSGNTNPRVERQRSSLKKLHSFFANDSAENFRGLPSVRRVEVPVPLSSRYGAVMTNCILRSRGMNFLSASPEKGLTYVCLRDPSAVDQLGFLGPRQILTLLNESKMGRLWAPYYPFTLSIRDSEALYEFISGKVTLMILVDADALVLKFAEKGLHAEFIDHEDYIVKVSAEGALPEADCCSLISKYAFGRLFHEFSSIADLADLEAAHLKILKQESSGLSKRIAEGEFSASAQRVEMPMFKRMEWSISSDGYI